MTEYKCDYEAGILTPLFFQNIMEMIYSECKYIYNPTAEEVEKYTKKNIKYHKDVLIKLVKSDCFDCDKKARINNALKELDKIIKMFNW